MESVTDKFIEKKIGYPELIDSLRLAFREGTIQCPPKSAYNYKSSVSDVHNSLLFMPAWDDKSYFGTKLITATPYNAKKGIPYLNGLYLLFNAENGLPLICMDAKLITNMRTAATSVLASNFLAKKDASKVLVMGNGSLAPYYIRAYASKQSVTEIYVWGRNFEKSKKAVRSVQKSSPVKIAAVESFDGIIKEMDIISCIMSSYEPLVGIEHLSHGQHYDLAGSYTEKMQEVTTEVLGACSVFVDNFDVTIQHSGEIVNALKESRILMSDIQGDLAFLCKDDSAKRKSNEENTLFKCTGMAIEDLVMAQLIYTKYNASRK